MTIAFAPPASDCPLCPRLAGFRADNRKQYPEFFNAPVPSFGGADAALLVVGLAPGLKGANATGRPFTGDYAGLVLYEGLLRHGFAEGTYGESPEDGLQLVDCRITNAVRCVPPENKPVGNEISACRPFLSAEIAFMPRLRAILSLGGISHKSVLAALGAKQSAYPFVHGNAYEIGGYTLFNSYHCSRYNINTGRLTQAMFNEVVGQVAASLRA